MIVKLRKQSWKKKLESRLQVLKTRCTSYTEFIGKLRKVCYVTLAASHKRTDLSYEAVTNWDEFGLKRASEITDLCSSGVLSVFKVSMFQRTT